MIVLLWPLVELDRFAVVGLRSHPSVCLEKCWRHLALKWFILLPAWNLMILNITFLLELFEGTSFKSLKELQFLRLPVFALRAFYHNCYHCFGCWSFCCTDSCWLLNIESVTINHSSAVSKDTVSSTLIT